MAFVIQILTQEQQECVCRAAFENPQYKLSRFETWQFIEYSGFWNSVAKQNIIDEHFEINWVDVYS